MVSEDLPILLTWPKLNCDAISAKSKFQGLFKSIRRSYDVVGLIDFDRFDVTQRVDLIVSRISQEKTIQQW